MNNFLVKKSGLSSSANVKTLMLIHGWGMNSQVWQPIRESLESRFHIIWVDLPGHGFNRDIKALDLDNMVALIASHLPKNTHIIAWSLGGLVSQALAHKMPEYIDSMTLVATTPRFSQQPGEWDHAMTEVVLNRFANNLKEDPIKTLKGFIALQFMGIENAKQAQNDLINHILYNRSLGDKDLLRKWGGALSEQAAESEGDKKESNIPSKEALDVGLSILKYADLRDLTASCPEHWIFGEYDRLIPRGVVEDLKLLRPDAQITLLEKSGHAPFITHNDAFLACVIDFIKSQD